MNDETNNLDSQCGENCITCQLVDEFKDMVKADVHWENALRHVIDIVRIEMVKDADLLIEESYIAGYEHGILDGIEQAQSIMGDLYNEYDKKLNIDSTDTTDNDTDDSDEIEDDDSDVFINGEEYDDKITFIDEDDENDKIQKLIKEDKK